VQRKKKKKKKKKKIEIMSIQTMKRKILHTQSNATKRSARPPGGIWLPQGPFGGGIGCVNTVMLEDALRTDGPTGFSINGGLRSIPVGQDMKMSQSGTRFRGVYALGCGGHLGRYARPEPLMNTPPVKAFVEGTQSKFIKPSVVSQRTMLRRRRPYIENGQYPHYWVQPQYTGNQTDSASQGLYLQRLRSAYDIHLDVNAHGKYVGYTRNYGPMGCQRTAARGYTMAMQQASAPYCKALHQPVDSSRYTSHIQRRCVRPTGKEKPFPFAVAADVSCLEATYLTPPVWYTTDQTI
jgi:hypothetical protein